MLPIGDTNVRGKGPAYVTIGLIVLNVLAFIYELTFSTSGLQNLFYAYAVQPNEIVRGQEWITLITSMFLHGGWMHLIGNMLFLWVFGDNIEHTIGAIPYLLFYLAGGVAASAAQILTDPASTIPSLGASGAIAAVMGAYIVMFPRSQIKVLVIALGIWVTRVSAILFLGVWFVTQFFNGVASFGVPTEQTSGVAFWAHVGGFVFGLVGGFLMRGRVQVANEPYDPYHPVDPYR